jgi:1-deoxy-D-xylulose-5-phosphate reductoisomerase
MKRKISILGATGSVGTSTLDLVERAPERFEVIALTAGSDANGLASAALLQARNWPLLPTKHAWAS